MPALYESGFFFNNPEFLTWILPSSFLFRSILLSMSLKVQLPFWVQLGFGKSGEAHRNQSRYYSNAQHLPRRSKNVSKTENIDWEGMIPYLNSSP